MGHPQHPFPYFGEVTPILRKWRWKDLRNPQYALPYCGRSDCRVTRMVLERLRTSTTFSKLSPCDYLLLPWLKIPSETSVSRHSISTPYSRAGHRYYHPTWSSRQHPMDTKNLRESLELYRGLNSIYLMNLR